MSYGHKFRSYVLNAPLYTRHLAQRAISAKIPIIRKRLISLDQAYNLPEIGGVNLVVNASGLGSYSLLGVSDQKVYPARGQTVLVDAPGVKTCVMRADQFLQNSSVGAKGDGEWFYLFIDSWPFALSNPITQIDHGVPQSLHSFAPLFLV